MSMAENGELMEVNCQQVNGRTVMWATVAGIAIGGPILGLMGLSFLSSLILLVISSPLLIIFSPMLIGAASVLALTLAGFGVAGVMAVLGLSSFVLVYRSIIKGGKFGGEYGGGADDVLVTVDKMIQPAEMVAEEEEEQEVAGTGDRTELLESVNQQQQQQDSTTSEPVTVDRMVELFESLKGPPPDNETTGVAIISVEIDDESEERQHDKDRASSGGYLQQNVQREIPQET